MLTKKEYHSYAQPYIDKVGDEDMFKALSQDWASFYKSISKDKINYKYGSDKWTTKEVLGHIIDVERVFQYRAMRIGRGDKTPLPGFDHNTFVKTSNCQLRDYDQMIVEYQAVRTSSLCLFESFTPSDLKLIGTASDHPFSTRALIYMIIGHERHHIEILKDRYL